MVFLRRLRIYIGSALFALGQVLSLLFFSTVGLLLFPFGFKVRYAFISQWAKFLIWWLRQTCGVKFEVHGLENVRKDSAGLILARHESAWETFAFQVIFPRQAYVLKKELLKIPFFGWGMAMLNPIAIDRGNGRQALKQLLNEGVKRLQSGDWVVIFPEGTRMKAGILGEIKGGGAMLANKAQAPVYLVAHNAGQYWPKNSFVKQPGTIQVHISPPLDVSSMKVAEINQHIENWFVEKLEPLEGITAPSKLSEGDATS